jgi:hypothetical protein
VVCVGVWARRVGCWSYISGGMPMLSSQRSLSINPCRASQSGRFGAAAGRRALAGHHAPPSPLIVQTTRAAQTIADAVQEIIQEVIEQHRLTIHTPAHANAALAVGIWRCLPTAHHPVNPTVTIDGGWGPPPAHPGAVTWPKRQLWICTLSQKFGPWALRLAWEGPFPALSWAYRA